MKDFSKNDPRDPIQDSDNQFLLSMYRLAVDYYQPKIEQRTDTLLGTIHVWDYEKLHQHRVEQFMKSDFQFKQMVSQSVIDKCCDRILMASRRRARWCIASYYDHGIYINCSLEETHERSFAVVVVHELTHALWDRLGAPAYAEGLELSQSDREKRTLLSEGYSTYAQRVWFRDLYPFSAREEVESFRWDKESVYERGFEKISLLVDICGADILLEIPSRWYEF